MDINCPDHLGNTPIHYAVLHSNDKIIDYILASGGDVTVCNKAGETVLHMCTRKIRTKLKTMSMYELQCMQRRKPRFLDSVVMIG